jgi:drug/metabolite transporter (DMT)-like permease
MTFRGFLVGFVGFALLLSVKDILYRYLLVGGTPVSTLLFISGLGNLILATTLALINNQSFAPKSWKFQTLRLITNCFFWLALAQGLSLVSATSVALFSKAYVPLLILAAPLLGIKYSNTQKTLAFFTLLVMGIFVIAGRASNESLLGFGFVFVAVLAVMIEFIMLRKSAFKESTFILAAVPGLACLSCGFFWIVTTSNTQQIAEISLLEIVLAVISGFSIYGAYFVTVIRYKILPLGLAEYPALLTAVVLLPTEYVLFNQWPSQLYLANLTIALVPIGYILYLNSVAAQKKLVNVKGPKQ